MAEPDDDRLGEDDLVIVSSNYDDYVVEVDVREQPDVIRLDPLTAIKTAYFMIEKAMNVMEHAEFDKEDGGPDDDPPICSD